LACALLSRILPPNRSGLSGFVFAFIGIYFTIAGRIMGRHEKRIYERVQKSAAASH